MSAAVNTPASDIDAPLPQLSERLKVRTLQVQGEQGPLAARLYTSGYTSDKCDTLMVFFHAGGFVEGDLEGADMFLRHLADDHPHIAVLASSYTLAGERAFPAAVEDAHAVLNWAKKHKAKAAWNGKYLLVAGIEAGANLAAVCALMSRDRGGPTLTGQILVMPMLDPGLSTCSMRTMQKAPELLQAADACAAAYRGYLPNCADRTHPYASPLQSSRLKNLPPALILSAEDDPLRDEAEQYGAKLIANGVKTAVVRMPPTLETEAGERNECACKCMALKEIASFISSLECSPRASAT